ncbi:MAG: hypothetical protein DWQ08_06250 [Proteobacteria bacterium]|nr:MAG: hypothetical protein DWQ08_06250 [Pseudomonadota bacterium]
MRPDFEKNEEEVRKRTLRRSPPNGIRQKTRIREDCVDGRRLSVPSTLQWPRQAAFEQRR